RRGVKWQNVPPLNGRELVAADIKYCFEAFAKEGVQAFTFQEIEGMETPDTHTLRIYLRTPNALFPQNVAEPVALIFSREVLVQALTPSITPFGLALAQDRPPFNDVRVRGAVSMAIDRQRQVETVYEGHGIVTAGVPWIYYQDAKPTAKDLGPWWQHRPADAKRLLAEAGHPSGFETTLFYYEYFPQMTSQVQLVQQDLKKNLNINVKITKLDYTSYYGRYAEGKWDGMAWGFQSGHAVGLDERTYVYMHSKSTKNFFRVNDPVIDELTVKLRQAPDRAEQRATARRIVDREYDQVL